MAVRDMAPFFLMPEAMREASLETVPAPYRTATVFVMWKEKTMPEELPEAVIRSATVWQLPRSQETAKHTEVLPEPCPMRAK